MKVVYSSNRESNYDLLRIIATVAVIIIHVNWKYFGEQYAAHEKSVTSVTEFLLNIITRFSVPVFVMPSCAFMLKNESSSYFRYFYSKSYKKILLPAIIARGLQTVITILGNLFSNRSLLDGVMGLLKGFRFQNLWFVYSLADVYYIT